MTGTEDWISDREEMNIYRIKGRGCRLELSWRLKMRKLWSTVSDAVLGSAVGDLLALILILIASSATFPKLQGATGERHHNRMGSFTISLAIGGYY